MSSPANSSDHPTAPADLIAALQLVLAAHHAALFSYPELGVHLENPAEIQRARDLEAAHRLSRDELLSQLAGLGATGVAPAVDYQPPKPVTDAPTAWQWALAVESELARTYRALLGASAAPAAQVAAAPVSAPARASYRRQALTGLTSTAGAAWYWRALLTPATPTAPFPGV